MHTQRYKKAFIEFSNVTVSGSGERDRSATCQIAELVSLLSLYLAIVFIASSPIFEGDEGGYVENATRMLRGPAASAHDLRLWWGPGYPVVLLPFIALGLPWIAAKLLNAIFLFGAITYFFSLLRRYIGGRAALITTLCFGLYPPLMRDIYLLCPESLTFFLMCAFMFHFCALYNGANRFWAHMFAASFFLAYLALTKVFFGYVIVALLAFSLASLVWKRASAVLTAIPVFLLALVLCFPYLLYTYSLTGKVFYWGTSGGMQLYWMTTPYGNELGSWFSVKDVKDRPELAPHRKFFASLEGLSDTERDDAYKKQAIHNIATHPKKYLHNWLANVGRLLFSYPFSLGPQSLTTYFYLVPNMFVVVLFLLSTIPAVFRPRAIPFELWALLVFVLIAFGGSTLLSAYDRQFAPLVPGLCIWMAFVYVRVLRIELRSGSEISGAVHPLRLNTRNEVEAEINFADTQGVASTTATTL
jgi:hypothetical protein